MTPTNRRFLPVVACLLPVLALGATVRGWPQIGAFWPGMSFEEARAAAPQLAWRDGLKASYTKKVLSITAPGAVTIGGLSHSVELQPGYQDNYRESFEYSQAVADAAECEKLTMPVLADIEKIVGSLAAAPKYDQQPVTDTTYHELKQAGSSSTISFETNEDAAKAPRTADPAWRLGIAQHAVKDTTIQVGSMYAKDEKGAKTCHLTTLIEYAPDVVPTETLTFDPSMLVRQANIALKHLSLEGVELPTDPYTMTTDCTVARQTGQLSCSLDANGASTAILAAAVARISSLQLDPARLDPDNPTFLKTSIPIVLTGNDRRPIDFFKLPRLKLADVLWSSRPTPEQLEAVYPRKLLNEGKTAHLALACQVQSDGSLVCVDTNTKLPTEPQALADYKTFLHAGQATMSLYIAAPKLKSGANSVGTVVSTPVSFKPQE